MYVRLLTSYAILSLSTVVEAFKWAAWITGGSISNGNCVATDQQGNVYLGGQYIANSMVVYDQLGINVKQLANGGGFAAYIVKFTSNGSFAWVVRIDGLGNEIGRDVATDTQGNVYIAGQYDSNPLLVYDYLGLNVKSLANSGSQGGYIVKFTTNGSFVWGARQDGIDDDRAFSVATDNSGNVYTTGLYASSPLFLYDSLGSNVKSIPVSGSYGSFTVKYMFNGTFVWVTRQDGNGDDITLALATDFQGNLFAAGYYSSNPLNLYDSLGFSVMSLACSGPNGAHTVKYSQNGSVVWASRQDGLGDDQGFGISADQQGNFYVVGYYTSSPLVLYDSRGLSSRALNLSGTQGAYVVKYSSDGLFLWSARQDGNGDDLARGVLADQQGNVYIAGQYGQLQPGIVYDSLDVQVRSLSSGIGSYSANIVKYASDGQFLWAARQDGNSLDTAFALATDQFNNVYLAGQYGSSTLFVYDSVDLNVKSLSGNGAFLVKYASDGLYITTDSKTTLTSSTSTYLQVTSSVPLSSSKSTAIPSTASSSLAQSSSVRTFGLSTTFFESSSTLSINKYTSTTAAVIGSQVPGFPDDNFVTEQSITNNPTQSIDTAFPANQIIVYAILLGVAFLTVTNCALCCWLRNRSNRIKNRQISDPSMTEMTLSTKMTGITTSSLAGTTATQMVTSHVLAVPQFLALRFGVDLRQLDQIARGGGGSIHHCTVLDPSVIAGYDGCKLIMKNLGRDVGALPEPLQNSFYQEISMLHLVRDQGCFAKLYGFTEQPATIILKYYELGSLKQYTLGENQKSSLFSYSKNQIITLKLMITQGLLYLHQRQFAHCDVKPDNVLLDAVEDLLVPRITDFGISRLLDDSESQVKAFQLSQIRGASISYAGPEVVMRFRHKFTEKSPLIWKAGDVYALSIVWYEILTRKKVWN